jgi:hypothetical protein
MIDGENVGTVYIKLRNIGGSLLAGWSDEGVGNVQDRPSSMPKCLASCLGP